MTRFLALFVLICLSGCSSMKVGAFCYIPYGQQGQCMLGSSPMPQPTPTEKPI